MTGVVIGVGAWCVVSVIVALGVARAIRIADERAGARGLRGER